MKLLTRQSFAITVLLALNTQTVWAHDSAEHAKEAAEKCASMQKMDMSTMAHKDLAMQALMQKCAKNPSTGKPAMHHSQMKNIKMNDMKSMPMKMDHSNMAMPATPASGK